MRLFLVRHGETDHNKGGLALGRADVPLNDTGRDQVRRVADALSAEEFAALFSSPLQRTRSTAEAIAQRTDRPVTVDERLIEMDVGQLDGMPMADVRAQHPDFFEKWVGPDGHQLRMPGGRASKTCATGAGRLCRSWLFSTSTRPSASSLTTL